MTEIEAKKEFKERLELIEKCYRGKVEDYKQALELGVKALEKQIPKKPMMVYDDKVDSNWCSCHICANGIGWEIPARKIKFCLECGQRLDFGDDEK